MDPEGADCKDTIGGGSRTRWSSAMRRLLSFRIGPTLLSFFLCVFGTVVAGGIPDAYEADDDSTQATPMGHDTTSQLRSIHVVTDQDWISFTLAESSLVTVETSGPSGDTRMWLYDDTLTELSFDENSGSDSHARIERTISDPLAAGLYFVRVDESGNDATIPEYYITLSVAPVAPTIRVEPLNLDFGPGNAQSSPAAMVAAQDVAGELYRFDDDVLSSPPASVVAEKTIEIDAEFLAMEPSSLYLELFDGSVLRAESTDLERRGPGNLTWRGRLEGADGGRVVLTLKHGVVVGMFFAPDGAYEIRSRPDGSQTLQKLGDPPHPLCGAGPAPDYPTGAAAQTWEGTADPPDRIDVMVMYTPEARDEAGGVAGMEATIQAQVDAGNTALADSDIATRFVLVHSELANYNDSGSASTDLLWVTNDPEVTVLRDRYSADMVSLLVENAQGVCGIGWVMRNPYSTFPAFQVTDPTCGGLLVWAHENGHNMGLEHDPANGPDPASASYPWSFGHFVSGSFRTVMSYSNQCVGGCTRVAHFSNPDVLHNGYATGIADERDNHRTANLTAPIVADFRQRRVPRGFIEIYNDGGTTLTVNSITPESPADWIQLSLAGPFTVSPESSRSVRVDVLYDLAPAGLSTTRLLVDSDDADSSPYPGGVDIIVDNTFTGDAYEPDNASTMAVPMLPNTTSPLHSIDPAADEDWIRFTVVAPSEVAVETSGTSGDTRMWLYDGDLTEIGFDDDGGTGSFSRIERLGVEALAPGLYFVRVDESGNDDLISDYEISLTFAPSECTLITQASPVQGGKTVGGGVHPCGSNVTATVDVGTGYRLVNWTDGVTPVSVEESYTFTLDTDRTLVANLVQEGAQAMVALPDIDSSGSPELAVLYRNASSGSSFVYIKDADTGALVREISVFGANYLVVGLVRLDNFDGSAAPEIAVAGLNVNTGGVRLRIHDALSGEQLREFSASSTYPPRALLVIPSFGGSAADEFAILGINTTDNRTLVRVRDGSSGEKLRDVWLPASMEYLDVDTAPDHDGTTADEIVLLAYKPATRALLVRIKDAGSGAKLSDTYFSTAYAPIDLAVVPDFAGTVGAPEIAVLGVNDAGTRVLARIKDPVGGAKIGDINYSSNYEPRAFMVVPDFAGTTAAELALAGVRVATGQVFTRIKDSSTGETLTEFPSSAVYLPQELTVLDDFGGSGAAEIAILGTHVDNGAVLVRIKDMSTGETLAAIPIP